MFIPLQDALMAGEITFIKVEQLNGDKGISNPRYKRFSSQTSLDVAGTTENNEVMFHYSNDLYNMSQLFTVNLMTYNLDTGSTTQVPFGELNSDVSFQQGSFVDQFTLSFSSQERREFGIVKLRFSDLFEEIIEF